LTLLLLLAFHLGLTAQAPARQLSAPEQKAVAEAAEYALKARDLWHGTIHLTNVEVAIDRAANPARRYALLTYYRYDGDLAILMTVELDKFAVTAVEMHAHFPTSLTAKEMAQAETLARAHPEIKKALAKYTHLDRIEADVVAARIIDPTVPGYQHRVARLFFRDTQRNYLQFVPTVDVDLTTGELRFDLIRSAHAKK
jgi:Cu2+-containing amine oxidase